MVKNFAEDNYKNNVNINSTPHIWLRFTERDQEHLNYAYVHSTIE